ncbi:MAG: response regulator [Candidatus Omnitrophota bacterium]
MSEHQKCLLIIDDEDDVCQIVKERFGRLGYKVVTANDGAEGFQKAEEEKPDCVLLDIRIPGGQDGLTFLRNLRSYRHVDLEEQDRVRKIPVIVLTGAGVTMQPLFEIEGIKGFIEKPFDLSNLQTKVEHILRTR